MYQIFFRRGTWLVFCVTVARYTHQWPKADLIVAYLVRLVVLVDEEPEGAEVVLQALRERQRFPYEPGAPLPYCTSKPLDVVGQPVPLSARHMPIVRDHRVVRRQEVGVEHRPYPVLLGQAQPQALGGEVRPLADEHRKYPAGSHVLGRSIPVSVLLRSDETPHLVGLDHDRPLFFGRGLGGRLVTPAGLVTERAVGERLRPAAGQPGAAGDGPQAEPPVEQPADEHLLFRRHRAGLWVRDELAAATAAQGLRGARLVRPDADHIGGRVVQTQWVRDAGSRHPHTLPNHPVGHYPLAYLKIIITICIISNIYN